MTESLEPYLQPGPCVNSDAPQIIALANSLVKSQQSDQDKAIALYYHVRDAIRYNPYAMGNGRDDWRATEVLKAGEGWCIPKAVLLAALCRAVGIPARLGFADVVNHLSTERLRQTLKTDVFYYHGYCSIFLNGRWVKSTPAFNLTLCEKFGLHPLEFDGENDSLYHEFDQAGNRHMEYINDRGEYADVPYEDIVEVFKEHYPGMLNAAAVDAAQWDADVEKEVLQQG